MALQTKMKTDKILKIQKIGVKYRGAHERTRAQQYFNTEEIHIIKAGKKINMQEFINANNEDAELIPTLEKYGCIDRIEKQNPAELKWGEENKNLRLEDAYEAMQKAKELWNSLNEKTREFYKNDFETFAKNFENDRNKAIQLQFEFDKEQAKKIKESKEIAEKKEVKNVDEPGK